MLQGILFKSAIRALVSTFFQGAKRNTDVFDTFSAFLRTKTVGLLSLRPKLGTKSTNNMSRMCTIMVIKKGF